MKFRSMFRFALVGTLLFLLTACTPGSDELQIDTSKLSSEALKGKKIFDDKNCKKCHTLGKSMMTVVKQGKEVIIPDLTNPFIATDSSYVEVHLKYVEETDMPQIRLYSDEIHQVSRFIAELHAATHGQKYSENADATCPVCRAPVNSELAKADGLWFTYFGETYYFECEACKELFSKQPEVFR